MQSFGQNLCVPSEPMLRPLTDCDIIDQFSLESEFFSLEEAGPEGWPLSGKAEEESQEETMEVEEELFSVKRRHCALLDTASRRPMFSKLQRMDRAPVKRRHF